MCSMCVQLCEQGGSPTDLDCISEVGGMDPNAGRAKPKYAISLL